MEEEIERVLEERAKKLAAPIQTLEDAHGALSIVTFKIGETCYGINNEKVQEVIHVTALSPLPCTPPFVQGMCNHRGQVIAVLDIRLLVEEDQQIERSPHLKDVLVIKGNELIFGLSADKITGHRALVESEIKRDVQTLKSLGQSYLYGLLENGTIILDIDEIISDPKIIINKTI